MNTHKQPLQAIVELRTVAVTNEEEQRLLTIINSDQTSPEEISKALNELYKLWSTTVLKIADIEEATVTSASSYSPENCNPEQIAAFDGRRVGNVT